MKLGLWFLGALLPICGAVQAARPDSLREERPARLTVEESDRSALGLDTLRRIDTVDGDLLRVHDGGEGGKLLLEVGGFGLTLGRTHMSRTMERRSRFSLTAISDFEFGFTHLSGLDYKGYAPAEEGFLEQRLGSSFHFSFTTVALNLSFDRKPKRDRLSLDIGMQYSLDNIRLSDATRTVGNDGRRLVPVRLDTPAEKSKIVYSSLGFVLRLNYRPIRDFVIDLATYYDFLLGADAIYKHPKSKHSVSGFSPFQFGIGTSMTYHGAGLFCRYSLTPLFRSSSGLEARALSFGFSCSLSF